MRRGRQLKIGRRRPVAWVGCGIGKEIGKKLGAPVGRKHLLQCGDGTGRIGKQEKTAAAANGCPCRQRGCVEGEVVCADKDLAAIGDRVLGMQVTIAPSVAGRGTVLDGQITDIAPCFGDLLHTPFLGVRDATGRGAVEQKPQTKATARFVGQQGRQSGVLEGVKAQIQCVGGAGQKGGEGHIESFRADGSCPVAVFLPLLRPQPIGGRPASPAGLADAAPPLAVGQIAGPVAGTVCVDRQPAERVQFALPDLAGAAGQVARVEAGRRAQPATLLQRRVAVEQRVDDGSAAIAQAERAAAVAERERTGELKGRIVGGRPAAARFLAEAETEAGGAGGAPDALAWLQPQRGVQRKRSTPGVCLQHPARQRLALAAGIPQQNRFIGFVADHAVNVGGGDQDFRRRRAEDQRQEERTRGSRLRDTQPPTHTDKEPKCRQESHLHRSRSLGHATFKDIPARPETPHPARAVGRAISIHIPL